MTAEILRLIASQRPAQGDLLNRRPEPAEVVRLFVPTVKRWHLWLRRQGLRISAGVGGATLGEAERFIRADQAKWNLSRDEAEADLASAMAFVVAVRDQADRIGLDPAVPGPGWGQSA